jgi:hypothetical protein
MSKTSNQHVILSAAKDLPTEANVTHSICCVIRERAWGPSRSFGMTSDWALGRLLAKAFGAES